jgi:2,3-bisphosphoglycerate-dependent phosphoglycerate mutase
MPTLILMRHGQSQWNLENRFTGWVDVDLTSEGIHQAQEAGRFIKEAELNIDHSFTSVLTRAIKTNNLCLDHCGQSYVPVTKDWRLNERHYGGLTGLDKAETAAIHGDEQVKIWRRSYDIAPPPLSAGSEYHFENDRRYRGLTLPQTESLKDTLARVSPFWHEDIVPNLSGEQTILVAAHGNSIRAIIKMLFSLTEGQILEIEVPTANPLLIELGDDLRPKAARYLNSYRAQTLPIVG